MGKSESILILLIYQKKTKLAAINFTKAEYRGNYSEHFRHKSIIEKAVNFSYLKYNYHLSLKL